MCVCICVRSNLTRTLSLPFTGKIPSLLCSTLLEALELIQRYVYVHITLCLLPYSVKFSRPKFFANQVRTKFHGKIFRGYRTLIDHAYCVVPRPP